MAKKLGKFLVCSALIGTAVAGGVALYNKFKASNDDFDDDSFDFDDFDDDFDDEADIASVKEESERGYVSIPRETDDTDKDDYKVNVDVTIHADDADSEEDTPVKEEKTEKADDKKEDSAKDPKHTNKK